MRLEDAQAMVAQMAWTATPAQREAIVRQMVQDEICALHAAWLLYGRPRGFACRCAPCLADPPIGSEVVMRILMQGRAPELTLTDNGRA